MSSAAGELRSRKGRTCPSRCEGYLRFAVQVIFVLHRNYLLEKGKEITLSRSHPPPGQAGWPRDRSQSLQQNHSPTLALHACLVNCQICALTCWNAVQFSADRTFHPPLVSQ